MFIAFAVFITVICLVVAMFILTRPTPPKKYPIFTISNSIEDHFDHAMRQLTNIANDSLSLYTSYNEEAFRQLVDSVNSKLDSLVSEIHSFDSYWQKFIRFKAQASFVSVCRSYSETRLKQIESAKLFIKDTIPLTKITNGMRKLKQNSANILLSSTVSGQQILGLQEQTSELLLISQKFQAQHPINQQYVNYICNFLSDQLNVLNECLQTTPSDKDKLYYLYNNYTDTWSNFNDTHVVDLINNEFGWLIDAPQQAMDELKHNTDYNT